MGNLLLIRLSLTAQDMIYPDICRKRGKGRRIETFGTGSKVPAVPADAVAALGRRPVREPGPAAHAAVLVCPVRRVRRGARAAVAWKLRVTWNFRTCYACFISTYCKSST